SVTNPSNTAVSGTTIRVRNESTGFTTTTVTNERGNFDLKQLPLGGPYTVTATHVQDAEGSVTGVHLNQGAVGQVDIQIVSNSRALHALGSNASGLKNTQDYLGAATASSSTGTKSLPVTGRNFTPLTDPSPLARGGSISGQL